MAASNVRFGSSAAGNVSLRWNGDKIKGELRKEMRRRIAAATDLVWRRAKALISVSGASKRAKQSRSKDGTILRKGAKVVGAAVSRPGEPPRKQTGRLFRSVKKQVRSLRGRVYSADPKAHLLEFGSKKMAKRPWLRRALAESKGQIRGLLSGRVNLPEK